MNEAVKMTQQILLGNLTPDVGLGVETRSMKKVSANKTVDKSNTNNEISNKDHTCKRLFQDELNDPIQDLPLLSSQVLLADLETEKSRGIHID